MSEASINTQDKSANSSARWLSSVADHTVFKSIWGAIFLASLASMLVLAILPDSGDEQRFPGQDKVAHAVGFCWLYVSGRAGLQRSSPALQLALVLAAYGIMIEALQYLGGYRSAELADFIADLAGIAVGMLICWRRNNG